MARYKSNTRTSQYKGVVLFSSFKQKPRSKPWRAYLYAYGKQISLGYYKTELEAAVAYNDGAINYFGDKAELNKIKE